MTEKNETSSGSPDLSPSSDAEHATLRTDDGALEPGSNATGDPTSLGEHDIEEVHHEPQAPNPSRLVQDGRVTTATDME